MTEPQYRCGSKRLRPFARSAGVRARSCSRLLQRVVTDLAADLPFAKAMDKLVEHYGIVIGESTIRQVTLSHAQAIHRASRRLSSRPARRCGGPTDLCRSDRWHHGAHRAQRHRAG